MFFKSEKTQNTYSRTLTFRIIMEKCGKAQRASGGSRGSGGGDRPPSRRMRANRPPLAAFIASSHGPRHQSRPAKFLAPQGLANLLLSLTSLSNLGLSVCLSVCLFVSGITQKLVGRFRCNFLHVAYDQIWK